MSRKIVKRNLDNAIAIIVDGRDEKWYIETVKKHYQEHCPVIKSIKIEPELPQKKKIQELFDLAKTKHSEGYNHVFLIIDLDTTNKDAKELQRFKDIYSKFVSISSSKSIGRSSAKYKWMQDLAIIINNPCLEYWFIIHFRCTNKFFNSFDELKPVLQKHLPDYDKSEDYYKGIPDIYNRLGNDKGLAQARQNSKIFSAFDIATCKSVGITEMYKLFDYFDKL